MEKAYIAIVVNDTAVEDLVDKLNEIRGIGDITVLAHADIQVADAEKDESALPRAFWLYQADCGLSPDALHLVEDFDTMGGRQLGLSELSAIRKYGVMTNLKVSTSHIPWKKDALDAAGEAQAADFDIPLLHDNFESTFVIGDGIERRWLRVIMPDWFVLKP